MLFILRSTQPYLDLLQGQLKSKDEAAVDLDKLIASALPATSMDGLFTILQLINFFSATTLS